MCIGDGQVDDNLNFCVSQQLLYSAYFGNAVFLRLSMGSFHIDIRTSGYLQNIKEASRFEVRGADGATSDDADRSFSVHRWIKSFLAMYLVHIVERTNVPESLSDSHPNRLLAPAALACFIMLCGKCAKRIFHTTL